MKISTLSLSLSNSPLCWLQLLRSNVKKIRETDFFTVCDSSICYIVHYYGNIHKSIIIKPQRLSKHKTLTNNQEEEEEENSSSIIRSIKPENS